MIKQYTIRLSPKHRGNHIITNEILAGVSEWPENGMLHLFLQHTSAAITINENADPDVLVDFAAIIDHIIPENLPFLRHTMEGPDDMPAHVKSALVGPSLTLPITGGKLNLGTWQGIYLCEFRNNGGLRTLVATVYS